MSNSKRYLYSIIIVNWNTLKLLQNCLDSLIPLTAGFEVIVVDNGSTDGSIAFLKKAQNNYPFRLRTIYNRENVGYGRANNQAMKIACGQYWLLLNSDTIVVNDAPQKMADYLNSHPGAGIVGCRLLNADRSHQPSAGPFPGLFITFVMLFLEHWFSGLVRSSYSNTRQVDWVMGAALMLRPGVVDRAGYLDEAIFMYMDEVEFCYRAKKAGFEIDFYPGAEIIHLWQGSSTSGRQDPIINIFRGLKYFYSRHYSRSAQICLRIMLKLKAGLAWIWGKISRNQYLVTTYEKAYEII